MKLSSKEKKNRNIRDLLLIFNLLSYLLYRSFNLLIWNS